VARTAQHEVWVEPRFDYTQHDTFQTSAVNHGLLPKNKEWMNLDGKPVSYFVSKETFPPQKLITNTPYRGQTWYFLLIFILNSGTFRLKIFFGKIQPIV
jgi:hypothetical protein